ncbi:hypothetical protein F5X96DRAFT_624158 [Biscogniauxia mediterranea]|nr:hypothetical protein F5X96DRAFT_624158 [Biscogniauxia mediterranea]
MAENQQYAYHEPPPIYSIYTHHADNAPNSDSTNYMGEPHVFETRTSYQPVQQTEPYATPSVAETPPNLSGWPTSPATVRPSASSIIADVVVDVVLLGFSVAFFAFGLLVRQYDQTPIDAYPQTTNALLQATKYGPSVFPILFACVVGRAAHAILIWRLEKGTYVGTLDLLAGSTSLTSTVTSQIQMRMISLLGVILLAIWALSPVGGQASFRQLSIGPKESSEPANYTYMTMGGNLEQYDNTDRTTSFGIVNTLLLSSLIAPYSNRLSSVDTWGNVKIPLIETYEDGSTPDSDGWFTTDESRSVYSSLVGLPIAGLSGNYTKYSVTVETEYFYINCPVVYGPWVEIVSNSSQWFVGTGAQMWSYDNSTERYNTRPEAMTRPRQFAYQWWNPPTNMTSNCSMTTTYVEAEISCGSTPSSCSVPRLRRSRLPHPPAAFTLIDAYWQGWNMFAHNFVNSVTAHSSYATVVSWYLVDPSNPLDVYPNPDPATADRPTNDVYAARLGQLLNTYWTCINGMHAVPGGLTPETAFMAGTNLSSPRSAYFLANSSTTLGARSTSVDVVQCSYNWVVALCVASAVMILASLVHPVVRYGFTTAPDLMLNFSSLAMRDNPYVALPGSTSSSGGGGSSGTFLGAADRARLLKRMRVRFGDVEGASEVGRLAVASLDNNPGVKNVGYVRKSRLYE